MARARPLLRSDPHRPPLRAVLLDAMGTLLKLEPPAPRLRELMRGRFGIELTEGQAAAGIAAEITFYRRHMDLASDLDALARLRSDCAEALRAALPETPELEALGTRELTGVLLDSLRFTAYPDAEPALRAWRARELKLVVVSNWDVSLAGVLEQVGLAPLLDGVITSAQTGSRKPAPEIFKVALAHAGVSAIQALHIGDSLEEDVHGAREAGIQPVLVARGGAAEAELPSGPQVPVVTELGCAVSLGHP